MSDNSKASDPVTDDEAREILSRFNASHFNNPGEHARYSIPARPEHDDDIRLAAYIAQTRELRARLAAAEAVCEAAVKLDREITEIGLASLDKVQELHDAIHSWRKEKEWRKRKEESQGG